MNTFMLFRKFPKFVYLSIHIFFIFIFYIHLGLTQETKADKEFTFAQKLYEDKLFILAAEQFNIFAKKYPNHEKTDDALFLAGESYFVASDYDGAFEDFKELELSFPQSEFLPKARFRLAQCQAAQNNYAAAAELFKRLPLFHPDNELAPKALQEAGRAFAKAGKDGDAIDIFFELIRRYPDTPERFEAHLEIVNIYFKKNEYDKALSEVDAIFRALSPDLKDPRIYLLRGEIFEKMGQVKEAESSYLKLVQEFSSRAETQYAYYHLGLLFQNRGLYDEALDHFDKSMSIMVDSLLLPQVYLKKGDILFTKSQYRDAIENYEKSAKLAVGSPQIEAEFKIGKCLTFLEEYEKAAAKFSHLLSIEKQKQVVENHTVSFVEAAYLELTNVLIKLNRFKDALNLIQDYSKKFSKGSNLSHMAFIKGEILEKHLGEYSRALRTYDEFLETFPFSSQVDDAQLALARCYEGLENYRLAVKEYDTYLTRYPAGEGYGWALERKRLISEIIQFDPQKELKKISQLFGKFIQSQINEKWDFELGKAYLDLKQFDDAVKQFKVVLANPDDGIIRDEVFYYLGMSYYNLAEKVHFQNRVDQAAAYFDSAKVALAFIGEDQSDTKWAEEAAFLLAKIELEKLSDPETRQSKLLEYYGNWVNRFPKGHHLDFILINLANELMKTSTEIDTLILHEVLDLYRNILENFPKSQYFEEAQFKEAVALNYLGEDSLAISKLSYFVKNHPNSRFVPEALFIKAKWERRNENFNIARQDLKRIQSKYFYSPWAAKAQLEIADIYFQIGDFQSALEFYQKTQDQWNEYRNTNGLNNPSYIFLKQAQAYENLGDLSKALERYLAFIRENPGHENLPQTMLAVARISQEQNHVILAKEYYESILQHYSQSQYQYDARIALGDILFQQEKYKKARTHYLEAIKLAEDLSKEKYPASQAVRCLYKIRQIAAADSEGEVFKKKFKDSKMEEGQFLLDKGKAYIVEKNFELAEKTFKKLKSDFKKTDFGAHGELGLGEVYLITNHTEDALKILTDIPAKYPDSEVTPLTYLNLGDFYFNSHQVENAITAFKKILIHPKAGENYPKAMRYLIKCYDLLQLWDQAIATTRDYLKKYPNAEDSFSKKIQLGIFLMKLKEYNRALEQFQKLQPYADDETEAEVQYYIGRCFMEMGNFQRATAEYLKVKYLAKPTKLPWDVTAQYEASLCLIRLGKIDQAKNILQQIILEQGTESNFGRFARQKLQELEEKDKSLSEKEGSL